MGRAIHFVADITAPHHTEPLGQQYSNGTILDETAQKTRGIFPYASKWDFKQTSTNHTFNSLFRAERLTVGFIYKFMRETGQ